MHLPESTSPRVPHTDTHGEYDIDKAGSCVQYTWCHYEPSDVAFCQITLALLFLLPRDAL